MANTPDKISELFGLLPSGFFKDEEELRGFVQDEKSLKEVYSFLPQGYFSDENEYASYFRDAVKKKESSVLPLSSLAKGDKSILEVVSGVDFKRPQPKQEGGSLEMSPSPSQVKQANPGFQKTKLSRQDEAAFQSWMAGEPDIDTYDYRGFYEAEKEAGALKPTINDYVKEDPNFHFYSVGKDGRILKSPKHETFSKTIAAEESLGNKVSVDKQGIYRTSVKIPYDATNPQSISMLDQIEADNNRVLYKDEKIQTLQGDFESRVKKEQEALFKKYQSQVEANPENAEALQAEFETEAMKIAELRSAEFAKVATDMLGQKEYEYLGKDAGSLSKLFQNILEGGGNAASKDKQINDIAQSVLSTVPEEMRESVQREINGIVMDVAGESDLGSMYLVQKTVADKMGRLQAAKASIEAKYQESMAKWKDAPAQAVGSAYTAGEVMLPTGTSLPKEIQEIQKQRIAINNALNTYEKALKVPTAKSGSGVAAWREAVPDILTVGMAGMIDAVTMASLVSKQEKGNTTEEEDAIIDAYGSLQTLKGMASQEFNAYRRNQSIAGSIAYMEMMLLTGGAGGTARKIGMEASKKFVEGKIKNKLLQEGLRRVTRTTVEGAVSAGLRTPLAPATYKGIAEASMGDFKIENGQFVVDEATRPSIVKAIGEGAYNSAVDIFSESLGGIVDVRIPWLQRSLTPTVRKAFQSVGLNGLQGEYFEELAAAVLQGEAIDKQLLGDLAITIPAMVGGMGIIASPSTIANANSRAKRKDLIDTFGRDKITAIRDAIQNKNEDALLSIVNEAGIGLIEGGLTPEQAKKKVKNLVEYASLYVAQTTKDEVSGAVEAKVEESVGAMPEGLRAQPDATQGELRFEPEVEETTSLTENTPINLARTQEIEQLAKNEGYEFEVEADSDSNMTTLAVYDSQKNPVSYDNLPQGIKDLADEFTQLMQADEVAIEPQNDVVEPLSPQSDTKVPLTGESASETRIDKEKEEITPVQYGRVTIPTETATTEKVSKQGESIKEEIFLDGETAGSVNRHTESGVMLVKDVHLDKPGSKEGRNIYYTLRDKARAEGVEYVSKAIGMDMTTDHSWNVWKSLEKRGEVVKVGNRYVWADIEDKEALVEKTNYIEAIQKGRNIRPVKFTRDAYNAAKDDFDSMERRDFIAKHPEIASNIKEYNAVFDMMEVVSYLDRMNLNSDELLDFIEKTSIFAENNKLNEKYGDFRTNVGGLAEYVRTREGGSVRDAAKEAAKDGGRGQVGSGTTDKTLTGEQVVEEDYDLSKDNDQDFLFDLNKRLGLRVGNRGYERIGNTIIRIKDHAAEWAYFRGDVEDKGVTSIVNVVVGDYRGDGMRWGDKTSVDEFRKEFPDVNIVDILIEDGTSISSAIDQISPLIEKAKSAVGAPIISETTPTTTEGEIVPPEKADEATDTKTKGSKEHRIGQRAMKSDKLAQEVKDGLAEKGIDYVPRAVKMVEAEVKELVNLYVAEDGGLQALEGMVYNTLNGLNPDTRTYLSVYLAEQYDKQLREATDIRDIERIKDKYSELIYQAQKNATQYGQGVRAQRKWQDVLGTHPDFIIRAARKAKADQMGDELFDKKEDVNLIYSTIKDFLKSPEFEQVISERVGEEIDKIASKRLTPQGKKKIDNFFNGMLLKTGNRMFDATLAIPIIAWNGSVLAVKKAVLLGVNVYDAIAAGVDYINEWHKKKYEAGEISSPQWREKEYIATMKEKLKPLLKKTSPSVSRKQPTESQTEKIVNKLYEKTSLLTKSQLRRLIKNSIENWVELGSLSQERFKNEVARAMGKPYLSTKQEIELYELAKSLSDVKNHGDRVDNAAKELIEAEENWDITPFQYKNLQDKLSKAVDDARKAQFEAQKAARKINEIFAEEGDLWDMISTLVKGNLLTPASLTVNIVANLAMPVVRGPKAVIASALDLMLSGIAYSYRPIVKRVSAEKHPWLYKQLQKLPVTQRSMYLESYVRGASFEGAFRRGSKMGIKQLWTGQLPDDIMKREIPRGLDPIKAAMRIVDGMKGRETMTIEQYITAFMEALPGGYTGEAMFRLLNLGDKPFREAAYNGRLSEIARQKGLKGEKRTAFMAAPDTDSYNDAMAEAYKAVWQNDNMVSKFINDISRAFSDKHKNNVILQSEVVKALAKLTVTVMAPYVKTPTNIVREAFEYAAPLYSMVRGIESAYKGDRRQSLNFFAKAIVGSAISWVALELFLHGIITPPPPDDDDKERQAMYDVERPSMFNLTAFSRLLKGEDPSRREGDVIVTYKRYGIPTTVLNAHIKAYTKVSPEELKELGYFRKQWMVMPMVVSSALDESFLSGMNTGLKGLMEGGPAMDNLLLNTSRALSASVYPNTAALVSKTFFDDNYIREVKDLSTPEDALKRRVINDFKDRMFMGKDLPTKVSIWGERVERIPSTRINITGAEWMRFAYMLFPVSQAEKVAESTFGVHIWKLYKDNKWTSEEDANKLLPSLPSAGTEVGWEKAKMTPQEYEEFQIRVGKRRAYYAEGYVGTEQWDLDDVETKANTLSSYYTKARKEVMAELFDWNVIKVQSPAAFKTTEALGILPFPSKVRKYKNDVFTLEEVRRYNEIATLTYVEAIAEVADSFEGRTQEQIVERAKSIWDKRLERAKSIVLKEKRVGQK